ncbi:unnamed protein product [Caenorhabditis bovis]|uniref:BTB domain-containing protein n=1 Tax=Caenorhabditis bovis TaxID=2654633 RepID=A0A8S1F9B9_9PELO|nr:unnamed protein product [Caenorhabditis bovis]
MRIFQIFLLSNGGYYLGKLVPNPEFREDVVDLLRVLLRKHSSMLDRQLFNRMEKMEFLEKVLNSNNPQQIRMLGAFSKSAWGRASLRMSGALDLLIQKMVNTDSDEERLFVVQTFKEFLHDSAGLRHMGENESFMRKIVDDVGKFVEKHLDVCQPQIDYESLKMAEANPKMFPFTLKDTQQLSEASRRRRIEKENEIEKLHKDFYAVWAYYSPAAPRASSPNYSPCVSPPLSDPPSGASSPTIRPNDSILHEFVPPEPSYERFTVEMRKNLEMKLPRAERVWNKTIDGELSLLTWLSQDEQNLPLLARVDIVDTIINYLRNTSKPQFHCYRVLRRLATLRTHAYQLIDMQFHLKVLTGLCATPCRMLKHSKKCTRCEKCAELGREILREFATHVDNSYGDAHINAQFTSDDLVERTKAAIAKIVLVKERTRLAKVPSLSVLFESLTQILSSSENFKRIGLKAAFENGPSIVSQIIGSLSILIAGKKIRQLCNTDSWYFPPENENCMIEKAKIEEENTPELLKFLDENQDEVVSAPMHIVCEKSEYFHGMFSSGFLEQANNVRSFQIDGDICTRDEFRLFVHLVCECTGSCSAINDADQCATILELADRYLCHDVSKMLSSDKGPLRTYLRGTTLPILLPTALTTCAQEGSLDYALLTLIRFATPDEITTAMEAISGNSLLVETFLIALRKFIDAQRVGDLQ